MCASGPQFQPARMYHRLQLALIFFYVHRHHCTQNGVLGDIFCTVCLAVPCKLAPCVFECMWELMRGAVFYWHRLWCPQYTEPAVTKRPTPSQKLHALWPLSRISLAQKAWCKWIRQFARKLDMLIIVLALFTCNKRSVLVCLICDNYFFFKCHSKAQSNCSLDTST